MAQTVEKLPKVYSRGMHNVITQKLNTEENGYEDKVLKWTGDTEFVFSPTQTKTELESGDDPAWAVVKGAVTGDVELTVWDIPLEVMEEMFSCTYTDDDGVSFGDHLNEKQVFTGISVERTVKTKSGAAAEQTSNNKTTLYKVDWDLPEISSKSVSKDDNALFTIKVKGHAYPVYFTAGDGQAKSRTYNMINSLKHSAKYEASKNAIVYPS